MENNSLSFGSKIRFVDRQVYKMLEKKNYIDYHHNRPNILKAGEFFSEEIRTCTGGGLVNPGSEALGFHLWDDLTNKKNFPIIINNLFRFVRNPERALLVGSKELYDAPYSLEQFQKIKKIFLERIKNVSIFEEHQFPNSETHYHYSLDKDTWTLCTSYQDYDDLCYKSVRNLDMLKKCFGKISIAQGDQLFIGKKEILASDAPEIFNP